MARYKDIDLGLSHPIMIHSSIYFKNETIENHVLAFFTYLYIFFSYSWCVSSLSTKQISFFWTYYLVTFFEEP
jgi:O-antigen ligase